MHIDNIVTLRKQICTYIVFVMLYLIHKTFFSVGFRSFLLTITELMGRLLGTWIPKNTANARFELHLWQTASFVLVTSYCSSLASRLASTEYEQRWEYYIWHNNYRTNYLFNIHLFNFCFILREINQMSMSYKYIMLNKLNGYCLEIL